MVEQQSRGGSWAVVALVFVLVIIGVAGLGLYSLFNSEEVKVATAETITGIGEGVEVLLIALAVGVVLFAIGFAVSLGGPVVVKGVTQRYVVDMLGQGGGTLHLPSGEAWEVYPPVSLDRRLPQSVGSREEVQACKEGS